MQSLTYNTRIGQVARIPALGWCLAIAAIAGCGGGGNPSPPVVKSPSIVTNPSPLSFVGGTATISAQVTDPTGVMAGSVKVNVTDSAGTSLIGGPQPMTLSAPATSTYSYQVTVPNNASGNTNKVYTATIAATNLKGVSNVPPVNVGTVTVPAPIGPPPPP